MVAGIAALAIRESWHVSLQSTTGVGRIAGRGVAAASGEIAGHDSAKPTGAAGGAEAEPRLSGIFDAIRGAAEGGARDIGEVGGGAAEDGVSVLGASRCGDLRVNGER